MSRNYTPRRAGKRWLESAPADVLDCFDFGGHPYDDRYTVILGKRFMYDGGPGAGPVLSFLHCSQCPAGISGSGEFKAHEAAAFRYRNGHKRAKWNDLPEAVRSFVERWISQD